MVNCLAIIGTRAQAIKMAPVVQAIRHRGLRCDIVLTGQHQVTVEELLAEFNLFSNTQLAPPGEVKTIGKGALWLLRVIPKAVSLCVEARNIGSPTIVLVHGDTVSTIIGTIAGRLTGCRVAHVEAGLRSGVLTNPFPEEAIRRIVTRLSHYAYCPGRSAYQVAVRTRAEPVDTGENTILDALREVLTKPLHKPRSKDNYVVVSAHRMETVMRTSRLRQLVDLTCQVAERAEVRFVLHPVTENRLLRTGLWHTLSIHPNVTLLPRMGYTAFIELASSAKAILTDGGGNQEEMAYLGITTIVLREKTERDHGVGTTTYLTGLDSQRVIDALKQAENRGSSECMMDGFKKVNPSEAIAEHLFRISEVFR